MAASIDRLEIDLILKLIRGWISLLSLRQFQEAAEYLSPSPDPSRPCTPNIIKEALGRYNRSYREASEDKKDYFLPSVSDPAAMDLSQENLVIYTQVSRGVALAEYDVPIDGEWSDLTASFILLSTENGFGLALNDLHVL